MSKRELFQRRLSEISSEIGGAKFLIVSKTRSLEDIQTYYELGQRDFGENRIQELFDKAESLSKSCPEIRWHMIGHLQSNKINQLFKTPSLYAIHSVHDRELLDKLIKAEDRLDHQIKIFLQFNTSHEAEKSGFETYTDLKMAAESALRASKLELQGLMTMGTLRTEEFEKEASRCFQDLVVEKTKLEAELGIKLQTSMGMSGDYKLALREGSDWIRLGTMMFGEMR